MEAPKKTASGVLTLAAIVTVVGFLPTSALQQVSACRTAADTAAGALYAIKQMLASNNADTSSVTLVADSTTCQTAINSYNTASDSTLRVPSGYLFQAHSTFVMYLPPAAGTPYKTEVLVLFDSSFRILVRMAGLG
jgi:hypothetical protein